MDQGASNLAPDVLTEPSRRRPELVPHSMVTKGAFLSSCAPGAAPCHAQLPGRVALAEGAEAACDSGHASARLPLLRLYLLLAAGGPVQVPVRVCAHPRSPALEPGGHLQRRQCGRPGPAQRALHPAPGFAQGCADMHALSFCCHALGAGTRSCHTMGRLMADGARDVPAVQSDSAWPMYCCLKSRVNMRAKHVVGTDCRMQARFNGNLVLCQQVRATIRGPSARRCGTTCARSG